MEQEPVSPPAYDVMIPHNAITITMEQEPVSPPSYDDFIRGIYRKDENIQSQE